MAEQLLHGPNVLSVFQQLGGEAMAKGMAAGCFCNARPLGSPIDGILMGFLVLLVLRCRTKPISSFVFPTRREMRNSVFGIRVWK
jgi:hypothetical protein